MCDVYAPALCWNDNNVCAYPKHNKTMTSFKKEWSVHVWFWWLNPWNQEALCDTVKQHTEHTETELIAALEVRGALFRAWHVVCLVRARFRFRFTKTQPIPNLIHVRCLLQAWLWEALVAASVVASAIVAVSHHIKCFDRYVTVVGPLIWAQSSMFYLYIVKMYSLLMASGTLWVAEQTNYAMEFGLFSTLIKIIISFNFNMLRTHSRLTLAIRIQLGCVHGKKKLNAIKWM